MGFIDNQFFARVYEDAKFHSRRLIAFFILFINSHSTELRICVTKKKRTRYTETLRACVRIIRLVDLCATASRPRGWLFHRIVFLSCFGANFLLNDSLSPKTVYDRCTRIIHNYLTYLCVTPITRKRCGRVLLFVFLFVWVWKLFYSLFDLF